jgi:hypothetical protein
MSSRAHRKASLRQAEGESRNPSTLLRTGLFFKGLALNGSAINTFLHPSTSLRASLFRPLGATVEMTVRLFNRAGLRL